jgi:hypothetical protein
MRFLSLALFLCLLSSASLANGSFRVSGDIGIAYTIRCENSVGQKIAFEGRAPSEHSFGSKKPLKECILQKHDKQGRLEFFYVQTISIGSVTQVYNFDEDVILIKPYERRTIVFNDSPSKEEKKKLPDSYMKRKLEEDREKELYDSQRRLYRRPETD